MTPIKPHRTLLDGPPPSLPRPLLRGAVEVALLVAALITAGAVLCAAVMELVG